MTDLSARTSALERRSTQQEGDIKHIYVELTGHTRILGEHTQTLDEHTRILDEHTRILDDHTRILGDHSKVLGDHSRQLRWLRQGMTSLLVHVGLDLPPDEPADEEE